MMARDAILTVLDFESTGAVRGYADEPWQVGLVELKARDLAQIRVVLSSYAQRSCALVLSALTVA